MRYSIVAVVCLIGACTGPSKMDDVQPVADMLAGLDTRVILEDSQGGLWLGTRGAGIYYRPPLEAGASRDWKMVSDRSAIGFFEDKDGQIWLAGRGVAKIVEGEVVALTEPEYLVNLIVFSIMQDPDGTLNFGTVRGLYTFAGGAWDHLQVEDGLPHQVVHTTFRDGEGALWLGTRKGGIGKLASGKWQYLYSEMNIRQILDAPDGALWFGTGGSGILRFLNGTWSQFQDGESLLPVTVDQHGRVWAGSESGVWVFDGKSWQQFAEADGLPTQIVNDVLELSDGRYMMATDKGPFYFNYD